MANYLVTGTAGFIAAQVTERLLHEGHTVFGVDNLNHAYDVRMKKYRLQKLQSLPGFRFQKMDISEKTSIADLNQSGESFDAVINLAARAGVRASLENPWVYIETNITGTLNLLEFCRHKGIMKFILASTSSIYGADAPLPTPEEYNSDRPLQPYAASKKGAEALCHAYHYLFGIDVTIFRYFTVYGPAGRPDMVMFRFAKWTREGDPVIINGDGHQSRGFTYVDDIARGTILGLKPVGFEIINLGGHQVIEIIQLLSKIESLLQQKATVENRPFHPADMTANWADISKAKQLLGWEPQISLDEGIRRMVDWYNQERSWASQIQTG